jgi:hypothetical protein
MRATDPAHHNGLTSPLHLLIVSDLAVKFRQPSDDELWFLPLGGSGEIGMNLNLFGHDDCWLMVDCGITFERQANGDNQIEMPDPDGAPQAL